MERTTQVHKRGRGGMPCINENGNRKQAFLDEGTVWWFIHNSPRRGMRECEPYECADCGLWHYGRRRVRPFGVSRPRGNPMTVLWRMYQSIVDAPGV